MTGFAISDIQNSINELEAELLLLEALNSANGRVEASWPIAPVPRNIELPLSFSQQGLWVLDQLKLIGPAYNISAALRITGDLRLRILERSFDEIIRRHEILRTTFIETTQSPVQKIAPNLDLPLTLIDLSRSRSEHLETEIHRLITEEACSRFDLTRGPLLRVTVLRLSPHEHIIVIVMHHIISDGWSMGVLLSEVSALYTAYSDGLASPLPELPIQYADYAYWERQRFQAGALSVDQDYWVRRIGSTPPVVDLPTDRCRPALPTFRGATHFFKLPLGLSNGIDSLSMKEGVTPFMVLAASLQALLYYHTSQSDIIMGTDVANRGDIKTEKLIGLFVNQLALRVNISESFTFRDLLNQVREAALGAYEHQAYPFYKLVEELTPKRDGSRSPLFQIKLVLQNAPMPALEIRGLALTRVPLDTGTAKFELLMNLWKLPEGLTGALEYNGDLFDASTISRFVEEYETVLMRVIAQPEIMISRLKEVLAESRRKQRRLDRNRREESNYEKLKNAKPQRLIY